MWAGSVLNIIFPSTFTTGNDHPRASGGIGNHHRDFLDTSLSDSWPCGAITPLQAYLLGVLTCAIAFAAYNFFHLHPSIPVASRRGGLGPKRKKSSSRRKNRNVPKSGTNIRFDVDDIDASNDVRILRPAARTEEKSLSNDKVYGRLASRIRKRAAARVVRKSARRSKKPSGAGADCQLEPYSIGRGGIDRHRYGGFAKLSSRVIDRHPIARNRARYHQKAPSHSKESRAMAEASAYNDANIWRSSTMVSGPSFELFRHMNSQPLHKEAFHDEKKRIPLSSSRSGEPSKIRESNARKTVELVSGKENVDRQLAGNSPKGPKDAALSTKRRSDVVKKTRGGSKIPLPSGGKFIAKNSGAQITQSPISKKSKEEPQRRNGGRQAPARACAQTILNADARHNLPMHHHGPAQLQAPERARAGGSHEDITPQKNETPNHDIDLKAEESVDHGQGTKIGRQEGTESFPTQPECNGDKPTLVTPGARLTVLVSNGVFDYVQKANQKAALHLLDDLCIPYNCVDGMDPRQRAIRDAFFTISGVRGGYPQIFSHTSSVTLSTRMPQIFSHNTEYLGGYDWLYKMEIEDLKQLGEAGGAV